MDEADPMDLRALARAARQDVASGAAGDAGGLEAHGEQPGDTIGSYELIRPLGEGGMGTVWEVRQHGGLERRAALKLIKLGMDTGRVVARFEAERQVLARMVHPHIASVFDGGATEHGRPYFVMELVAGPPIGQYASEHGLGLEARVGLMRQVCAALEHAHQKGVVHRDVKPSNVLVGTVDGAPHVKVIDFGIARTIDDEDTLRTRLTTDAEIVGTLEFMAPEQARGDEIDTRADVYAAGALLYELLCGRGPFDFAGENRPSLEEALRTIRETEPARPSTRLARGLDPRTDQARVAAELDWIVLRALEKDPERRYPTVASLDADLARFLRGDAVEARPPSRSYLVSKFVKRNRGLVASIGALVLALSLGVAGTAYGLVDSLRANEALGEALDEKENQRLLAVQEGERADREAKAAKRNLAQALEANGFLSTILTSAIPRHARGKDKELMVAVLEDATGRLAKGELSDPIVGGGVTVDVAEAWIGLGDLEQGLGHLEDARALYLEELEADTLEVLSVDRRRADVMRLLERPAEAIALYRETLPRMEVSLGAEDPVRLATRRGLASALHRAGQVEEARTILTEVIEVEARVLSDAERAESSALAELGTLEFFAFREPEQAKEHLTEALELVRAHQGPDHPWALRYMETLSQIQAMMGDVDGALELCAELSEQYARIYGPEHRETLAAEGNRAFTMSFGGRFEESDALMRKVLEAQRRTLGDEAPDTVWTRLQVALADLRNGEAAAARDELREVVRLTEERGVPAFDERGALAQALMASGETEEAVEVLTETIERARALMGSDHPMVGQLEQQLASFPTDD